MKKVVFYNDKPGCEHPSKDVQAAVLARFETNVAYWCHATPTSGFESGVDWDALVREGAVAVVLYDVNDACVFGISLEAGQNAGLEVYELFDGRLWKTLNVQITGKVPVLNLERIPEVDFESDKHLEAGERP